MLKALETLKDKRKKLGDCAVRANIKLRDNELKKLSQNLEATDAKYQACLKSIDDLLAYHKTPEERRQVLIGYKIRELVAYHA